MMNCFCKRFDRMAPLSQVLSIANLRHAMGGIYTCSEAEFRLSRMKVRRTTAPQFLSSPFSLSISFCLTVDFVYSHTFLFPLPLHYFFLDITSILFILFTNYHTKKNTIDVCSTDWSV